MEECDDGNNVNEDGCDAMCVIECDGELLVDSWNGWTYYKVPVMGAMTDSKSPAPVPAAAATTTRSACRP